MTKLLYSRKEAAQKLSLSVRTIARLIEHKKIRAKRIGRRVLIPSKELEKLGR